MVKKKKVAVIGLGYVGLPLLCAIANSHHFEAVGFDHNKKKVSLIKEQNCPIDDKLCAQELKRLSPLSVSVEDKILENSDFYIVCVPTPVLSDYTPDYGPVESASQTIGKYLKKGNTVIIESTVNPGTCEEVVLPILEQESRLKGGKDFILAYCPERINPGDSKWNVYNIPRNIGSFPANKVKIVSDFYRSILKAPINEVSSLKVSEATKIVENSFRDINIAFVNELAKSFDVLGIDLVETLQAASNKPFSFLPHWPSRGVGGHCIAVDPYYLISRAAKSGFEHRFLKVAREINNSMPKYLVSRLQEALNELELSIKGTKIGLLGLSYKANVGDLRESPCLMIKKTLELQGADLLVYDPYLLGMSNVKSLEELLKRSTAVVLGTMHDEFQELEKKMTKHKNIKVVIDGMNKLNKETISKNGLIYKGIGH